MLAFVMLVQANLSQAQQQELPEPYSDSWSGAFSGLGLLAGTFHLANEGFESSWGFAFGAKVRMSMVLTLFDLQLAYLHTMAWPSVQDIPIEMDGDSVSFSLGVHPLFFLTLFDTDLAPMLASLTLQGGIGLEFNRFDWEEQSLQDIGKISMHLGILFDVPLDDVNDGGSFWLGAWYRYNRVPTELHYLAEDEQALSQHLVMLRFAYRVNGYVF